jgi:hypothetical protein
MLEAALAASLESLALPHTEHLVPMATANLRAYLRMESDRNEITVGRPVRSARPLA